MHKLPKQKRENVVSLRYLSPKPSHSVIALLSSRVSFSLSEYSGSTRVLKQVWAVGRWSVSGPALWICYFYFYFVYFVGAKK